MERYAPDKLERATRDVVSRAGYMEIMSGRGTPAGGVLLDASHIPDVARHFAGMCERCREYGFDLVNDRVEVSPSAHYHMGGIKIDVDCRTNIDGLFAAGEDTGGIHGANRLGGNGVADSIVFGARAGDTMVNYIGEPAAATGISRAHVQQICERWTKPFTRDSGENPFKLREQLERLMWTKVGVVRNGPDMQAAVSELQEIRARIKNSSSGLSPSPLRGGGNPPSAIYNAPWNESINTENLALVAEMLTRSALAREESRGAHYRSDFPEKNFEWLKNVCIKPNNDGRFEMTFTPVEFTRLTPEELKEKGAGLKSVVLDDE
jgi:succinate dehydrogenase / fumarate reductase flavoprotein subunit/fumarate reductase flavoprotein subunit